MAVVHVKIPLEAAKITNVLKNEMSKELLLNCQELLQVTQRHGTISTSGPGSISTVTELGIRLLQGPTQVLK